MSDLGEPCEARDNPYRCMACPRSAIAVASSKGDSRRWDRPNVSSATSRWIELRNSFSNAKSSLERSRILLNEAVSILRQRRHHVSNSAQWISSEQPAAMLEGLPAPGRSCSSNLLRSLLGARPVAVVEIWRHLRGARCCTSSEWPSLCDSTRRQFGVGDYVAG